MGRKNLDLIAISLVCWACNDAATVGKETGDGTQSNAVGGGMPVSGGASSFGGEVAMGGGMPVSGGASSFGGEVAMGGGIPVSGGASSFGGEVAVGGGMPVSGGASSFGGGMPVTGGMSNVGGATAAAGASGVAAIAQKVFGNCGFNIIQPLTTASMAFPTDLTTATPRVFWDQLTTACTQGGWDVNACAGKEVVAVTGVTDQVVTVADGNHPISVSAWIAGDKVCCLDGGTDMPGAIMAEPCDAKVLAQRTLDSCNISHSALVSSSDLDVPAALTGPNWAIKAEACTNGGWDLSQCAGAPATFSGFAVGSSSTDQVWVVSKNDKVCCVYGTNGTTPGVVSASCQK